MANINITSDAWTEISITSGTVQNISATADIELSAEQTDNSGVVLKPSELYQWDNETIYARAVTEDKGALRVVNFKKAAGGGGGYVLPVASASTLGGVKVGNNLSIDASGVLSANSGGYTLPPATTSTLGGVIIGDNVTVDANGEISVAAPYSLPKADASTLGGVKIGSNISVDSDGVISTHAPYSLPKAAAGTLGGVKVGTNLSIDGDGVLSADGYTLPAATANDLGGVKIGSNVNVDANGVISVAAPYTLPTASENDLGGVKIGSNITIDGNGAISAPAAYTLPTAAANTLGGIKIGQNLYIDANGVLSAATPSTDPVGRVVYDVILRTGYIKANGATVSDASTAIPLLLAFVQANPSLLAANQAAYDANVGLYLYDSGTDALTLPNYGVIDEPIGTVIDFMGTTAPTDYVACDGTIYNIDSQYANLAEYINTQFGSYNFFGGDGITTFAVPDLRGEFLRGSGTNSHTNQGNGANVGTHQDASEFRNLHCGTQDGFYWDTTSNDGSNKPLIEKYDGVIGGNRYGVIKSGGSTVMHSEAPDALQWTTRPTNTSVLYCIKYRSQTGKLISQIRY